ncbi:MAG: glutathione S-transferase family protein [Leptolyngbyaceae cyanobacterium MO_188.B28]|nr:glutathione S-transferase family protein [Leptolyngbyaceae cyanobacterium MO_188.B28]
MLTLYHSPMTRSLRVFWVLEELGLEYVLKSIEFIPPTDGKIFVQNTPIGRFPTLEDGEVTFCESGAIVEYLIERYGENRLAPPLTSPLRAKYLQWMHFPEGTLNPYINAIRRFAESSPGIAAAMSDELDIAIGFVNAELADSPYIVGKDFTGADIMLAVSLLSINMMGLLAENHTHITPYLRRLQSRPALAKVMQSLATRAEYPEHPVACR